MIKDNAYYMEVTQIAGCNKSRVALFPGNYALFQEWLAILENTRKYREIQSFNMGYMDKTIHIVHGFKL